MMKWTALGGPAALVFGFTGTAFADVTGPEVWQSWQNTAAEMGQTLTPGEVVDAGDSLTLRDVAISMDVPEVKMSGTIGEIVFTDRPGGTVEITFSPNYELTMSVEPEVGESATIVLRVDQPGLSMIASGGDGTVAYDIDAPEITVSMDEVVVEGEAVSVDLDVTATGTTGRYELTEGAMTTLVSQTETERLSISVNAVDPESGEQVIMNYLLSDVVGTSDGSIAMFANPEEISSMLAQGFASKASVTTGASSYDISVSGGPDEFSLEGSGRSGSFDVGISAEALMYALSNSDVAIRLSGSDIPLPEITATMGEIGFGLLMPVIASDSPQDFGLSFTLADLAVSDMIWGLFDPAGALPRDPATLIFDVAGTANWLFDILDPEVQESGAMAMEMPGELHSLDINEFRLAAVGADLTGTGAFTFDNTDLETFDGLPAPDGRIDLQLVGANALIDSLVAMGLLPEDQAMGARMMMGMFARPGDGPDTLVSTIEVKPDGSVLANGQRLQ